MKAMLTYLGIIPLLSASAPIDPGQPTLAPWAFSLGLGLIVAVILTNREDPTGRA